MRAIPNIPGETAALPTSEGPSADYDLGHEQISQLQSALSQWVVAALNDLDMLVGQQPLSGRSDPMESAALRREAGVGLALLVAECAHTCVGALLSELIRQEELLRRELVGDPSAASLVDAHRTLHVGYSQLMARLGDELRFVTLQQPVPDSSSTPL